MSEGFVHSIQSMGAVDGPGVRFVAFLQGCPLRCACCHNPDTWEIGGGKKYSADELARRCARYREYFGRDGGITLSGGEPLLQADFAREVFELCHRDGINTCLDTSGCMLSESVKELLEHTDRVLLDVKYTNAEDYRRYVLVPYEKTLEFLRYLNEKHIATTLRQVIIPTVNDTDENVTKLAEIAKAHGCVDKVELLPFRKICTVKYNQLGIAFPFEDKNEPSAKLMERLNAILRSELEK